MRTHATHPPSLLRWTAFLAPAVLLTLALAIPLAAAQEPSATLDPRPTLPPTWTLTPTRLPSETPLPAPTATPTLQPTPTASPYPTPLPAPPAVRLEGMRLIWQDYNGCAAAALSMLLIYHGWDGTRDGVARGITPNRDDVSVRGIEMVAFVEGEGLRAAVRTGGTLAVIKELVAAGYPVLVENAYNPGGDDWMGHNRVIMGYDDAAGAVYTFDSVLGNGDGTGRPIPYAEFDALWKPFNRTYLVVYPAEAEPLIQVILGPHWNATENARLALDEAQAEIGRDPADAFALFNLGTALLTLGRAEEAITAFERALATGLPWRYLWYQFGPFEAYLLAGRYDRVIALGEDVLATTRNAEEIYFFLGQAYAALGDSARAAANYQAALTRNPHYIEADLALGRLPAG